MINGTRMDKYTAQQQTEKNGEPKDEKERSPIAQGSN